MLTFDYTYADLVNTLRKAGLQAGDTIMMHSDLAAIGIMKEFLDGESPSALLCQAIFALIGDAGTLIVPTFSYSFCRGEIYDPENSKSAVGYFGNWFRKQPSVKRSKDPIFSMAGLGPNTDFLFDIGNASFDERSTFAKLEQLPNAKALFIGAYCKFTAIHYAQYTVRVPIRYDKLFSGQVREGDTLHKLDWIYYVRADIPNTAGRDTIKPLLESGLLQTYALGKTYLSIGVYQEIIADYKAKYAADGWYGAAGPAIAIPKPHNHQQP